MKKMNRVKIFGAVVIVGVAAAFTVFADKKNHEKTELNNTLTTPDAIAGALLLFYLNNV